MAVLRRPRLWIPTEADYPRHSEWLDKVEAEVLDGSRRAFLARNGLTPTGVLVYKRDDDDPTILKIRNISVPPEERGRFVASYMLRNVELEIGPEDYPGVSSVVIDTKLSNREMLEFLIWHGYSLTEVTDLYQDGTGLDAVLTKSLLVAA